MTEEQRIRLNALGAVLGLYPSWEETPSLMDVIAMAEWVADGSISAATAAEGNRHVLYREHVREDDE